MLEVCKGALARQGELLGGGTLGYLGSRRCCAMKRGGSRRCSREVRFVLDGLEDIVGEGSGILSKEIGYLLLKKLSNRRGIAVVSQQC